MSSTEHFRRFRCRECGEDSVIATEKKGKRYKCECACGHTYFSSSIAAAASYERLKGIKQQATKETLHDATNI